MTIQEREHGLVTKLIEILAWYLARLRFVSSTLARSGSKFTSFMRKVYEAQQRKTTHTDARIHFSLPPFRVSTAIITLPISACVRVYVYVCSSVHVFTSVLRVRSKFLKQVYSQERQRREHSEDQAKLLRKFRKKHITRNEMMRRKPLRNKRALADQKKRRYVWLL